MGERRKKSKKPSGTNAERRLSEAVFLTDACLGKSVGEALRAAGWVVEWHLDHFPEGTEDVDWLPVAVERGWVVLTKDKAIRRKPWEREKVIACGARLFTLPSGSMSGEDMAKTFLDSGRDIGRTLHRHPWPFVAQVSRQGVTILLEVPPPDPSQETDEE